MSEEKLINFDTRYKLLPPLRTKKDNSVFKRIENKTIDVICSDHSPENIENKKIEFDNAAFEYYWSRNFIWTFRKVFKR